MALKGLDWHREEINACLTVPEMEFCFAILGPLECQDFRLPASGQEK